MSIRKTSDKRDNNLNDVQILYTKIFTYLNKHDKEQLGGHPYEGRIYRAFYDKPIDRYRLIIEEKLPSGLDGLLLTGIKGGGENWRYEFVRINDDNIMDLDIHEDDFRKLEEWKKTEHKDLIIDKDGNIEVKEKKRRGRPPKVKHDTTIKEDVPKELPDERSLHANAEEEERDQLHEELTAQILPMFDHIKKTDPHFYDNLLAVLVYLYNTFHDKYQTAVMDTKPLLYSAEYGKGANMMNVAKYTARYLTEDFPKSNHPQDLFKIIHYCLFELTRRYKLDI